MAITTYAELQTAISDYLARTDLGPFIPDFISMAENWLNYGSESVSPLRTREMEAVVSLVPVNGVVSLPADYLEALRVSENTSYKRTLNYITSDEAERLYPDGAAGLGTAYSIIGTSLYTFPLVSNNVNLVYYQAIPPLASNTTNWLLDKSPSVYLRASLMQAADYTKDDGELTKQAQLAGALIAGLNRSDMMGKYRRAGVSMRGPTP
ncbi:hypothetical protein EJ076_34785 [Mesorhizobium sp. M7D.F.Ca.US.005.01.1.1]|uniref:phage adaptor protein n=1 Tax=Mesorhizobium sp. M7D.F.Ca.US.005.01.1.1 TaxID=2493678 RepID=UPI000F7632A8|nr:hypothetical protein [Mesorhizobium sp. M7D.F.Ca.US.005.01.1.1]AZO45885.1 hypothetical protein EJ076_34785 [Mesorhizobium sp. M7D.F.Ca.US.005.01.1.1]